MTGEPEPHPAAVLDNTPHHHVAPTTWTVALHLRMPHPDDYIVHPSAYTLLLERLKPYGPAMKFPHDGTIQVAFGVAADTYAGAERGAESVTGVILKMLSLTSANIQGMNIMRNDELQARLDVIAPAYPDCVGVVEAAGILGVSKQRVSQLAERADFPRPVLRLRQGPVWREDDVRQFALNRPRSTTRRRPKKP